MKGDLIPHTAYTKDYYRYSKARTHLSREMIPAGEVCEQVYR